MAFDYLLKIGKIVNGETQRPIGRTEQPMAPEPVIKELQVVERPIVVAGLSS